MGQVRDGVLWILASFSLPIVIFSGIRAIANSWDSHQLASYHRSSASSEVSCQTLIADPNPPLNIRSSPVVADDNKIASLPNGTTLSIVDEQDGWLRINSPLQGWVYKDLTVTSCVRPDEPSSAQMPLPQAGQTEQGHQLLAIAMEQYQSGKFDGAIALAKTISPQSPAHRPAQRFIQQSQQDWQNAEAKYYVAQKALRDGRHQDVINEVAGYPDIRYWREKMTVIVQQAIAQD